MNRTIQKVIERHTVMDNEGMVSVTPAIARKLAAGASLILVHGVSMEPTILHGDTILVEKRTPRHGSVVVVQQEGRFFGYGCDTMIARAQRIGGELWLVKDNTEEFGDYAERLNTFTVVGLATSVVMREPGAFRRSAERAKIRYRKRQIEAEGLTEWRADLERLGNVPGSNVKPFNAVTAPAYFTSAREEGSRGVTR